MRSLHLLAIACTVLLLSVPASAAPAADADAGLAADAAADASVPCPDGSLGQLFCDITDAINAYCEREFGDPCIY